MTELPWRGARRRRRTCFAAYRADLEATGMFAENEVTSPARSFLMRVGPDGFLAMTLDHQLAVWGHDRRLVAWLIVTGRVRPTAEHLVASKLTQRVGGHRVDRALIHARLAVVSSWPGTL